MKKQIRIVITGSEEFNDYKVLKETLDTIIAERQNGQPIVIISGYRDGTEKLGIQYASDNNYSMRLYLSSEAEYEMLNYAKHWGGVLVLAYHDTENYEHLLQEADGMDVVTILLKKNNGGQLCQK